MESKSEIKIEDWGLISYTEAWKKQITHFQAKLDYKLGKNPINPPDLLVLCEHHPVYTLGKRAEKSNLLISQEELDLIGAEVIQIDRGGDITFHGPGQLVIYPIIDLENYKLGVKKYVEWIEKSLIQLCEVYGITAQPFPGHTGVWIEPKSSKGRKIAAIGIKCSRYISMHGAALNVCTDLTYFDKMIPCGISDKSVTSIQNETQNKKIEMEAVKTTYSTIFKEVFSV